MALGGRFCLSDDSHGVEQVSLNYHRVLEFLERVGVKSLHYLSLVGEEGADVRRVGISSKEAMGGKPAIVALLSGV